MCMPFFVSLHYTGGVRKSGQIICVPRPLWIRVTKKIGVVESLFDFGKCFGSNGCEFFVFTWFKRGEGFYIFCPDFTTPPVVQTHFFCCTSIGQRFSFMLEFLCYSLNFLHMFLQMFAHVVERKCRSLCWLDKNQLSRWFDENVDHYGDWTKMHLFVFGKAKKRRPTELNLQRLECKSNILSIRTK